MVVTLSYLHNGISYTGKMTSLYWIRALGLRIKKKWLFRTHKNRCGRGLHFWVLLVCFEINIINFCEGCGFVSIRVNCATIVLTGVNHHFITLAPVLKRPNWILIYQCRINNRRIHSNKDKMVLWSAHHYDVNLYTCKWFLFWNRPLVASLGHLYHHM